MRVIVRRTQIIVAGEIRNHSRGNRNAGNRTVSQITAGRMGTFQEVMVMRVINAAELHSRRREKSGTIPRRVIVMRVIVPVELHNYRREKSGTIPEGVVMRVMVVGAP